MLHNLHELWEKYKATAMILNASVLRDSNYNIFKFICKRQTGQCFSADIRFLRWLKLWLQLLKIEPSTWIRIYILMVSVKRKRNINPSCWWLKQNWHQTVAYKHLQESVTGSLPYPLEENNWSPDNITWNRHTPPLVVWNLFFLLQLCHNHVVLIIILLL